MARVQPGSAFEFHGAGDRAERWFAAAHQPPDASHAGADYRSIGKLRGWVHVPERVGTGPCAAIRRLARVAPFLRAGDVATAVSAGICVGVFVSEHSL